MDAPQYGGFDCRIWDVYTFVKRDFGNYILLRYHFVFFDFEELFALFLLDYVAIMGLFVCVGYYLTKWRFTLQRKEKM